MAASSSVLVSISGYIVPEAMVSVDNSVSLLLFKFEENVYPEVYYKVLRYTVLQRQKANYPTGYYKISTLIRVVYFLHIF